MKKETEKNRFFTSFRMVLGIFGFSILFFISHTVSAATLYLTPSSGSYGVGATFTVSVRANTQGTDVNTAEGYINYSADTLELVRVSQGSTFYLPAPGSPSKSAGTAYFGGGLPTPGYNGASGNLGTLTFRARAEGEASVTFSSGKVLLNDGLGTDAYAGGSAAHFTITKATATPPPPSSGSELVVTSTTHPDSTKWYPISKVDLSWNRPEGAYGYSFVFDQFANTEPDNVLDTTVTQSKTYTDLEDGVYYFHIKSRPQSPNADFSTTVHYKISIDTTKPNAFELSINGNTLSFATTDESSGVDHYAVFVDDKSYNENAESPLNLNLTGSHQIKVVAFDRGGNFVSSEISANFESGFLARLTQVISVPFYMILIFNLLLFILLLIIVWLLLGKKKERKERAQSGDIRQIQGEIDESLENLKTQISEKLMSLSEKSTGENFAAEMNIAKDIRSGIVKTRKNIDGKLTKIAKKKIAKTESDEKDI
jgi:hypothetical protein